MDDIPEESWRPGWAWPWRLVRTLLLAAVATTALVLGYMVFWPWDKLPPEDADLRQLQLPPPCAPEDNAWPLLKTANDKIVHKIPVPDKPGQKTPPQYWS